MRIVARQGAATQSREEPGSGGDDSSGAGPSVARYEDTDIDVIPYIRAAVALR